MKRRLLAGGVAAVLLACWASGAPPAGPAGDGYPAVKERALAATEQAFGRIAAGRPEDPALVRLRDRVAALDRATELVLRRLESVRAASMEKWIDDLPGRSAAVPAIKAPAAMRAAEIVQALEDDFRGPLPRPDVTPAERDLLARHYNAAVACGSSYVAGRGEAVAKLGDKAAAEAVQLALVIPLLTVPDEQWGEQDVAALPAWVRTPALLPVAETFAIAVNRPRAAYALASFTWRLGAAPGEPSAGGPLSPAEYFHATAARLVTQREYAGAIRCLRAGIRAADADKRPGLVVELREQLAAAYDESGHPERAAEEMKQQLGADLQADQYGKSAMLRLKYLYAADRFQEAAREAAAYHADERCKSYLPQVLYIEWVTLRRLERADEAKRVQAMFLERFPENLLGADMYFASAMTTLADGDYDEALRQLDIVEARYAASKLIPRVKEIRRRMENPKSGTSR